MMRLPTLLLVATLFAVLSCKEEPTPEELASRAAKEYYEHLVAGRYADYLAGMTGTDSIPEAYREQLLVNARQFMASQKAEHGGISEVRVVNAKTDSLSLRTDVFLLLCFGDSVKEEIVVPMVEQGGRWMMR